MRPFFAELRLFKFNDISKFLCKLLIYLCDNFLDEYIIISHKYYCNINPQYTHFKKVPIYILTSGYI